MTAFALAELKKIVDACYDGVEAAALDETALDTSFTDLGFDSLTVFEIVVRIQDEYAIDVPDERLDELTTPRRLVDYVAERLVETRA